MTKELWLAKYGDENEPIETLQIIGTHEQIEQYIDERLAEVKKDDPDAELIEYDENLVIIEFAILPQDGDPDVAIPLR